jgi:uncharacterized protein Yka (UPF0111/DUF47 family)
MPNYKLGEQQRKMLAKAVEAVGGFRAAARLSPLSDRCLRKAASDETATFRLETCKEITQTIELLQDSLHESIAPTESKLDRIERKLDAVIKHLGID